MTLISEHIESDTRERILEVALRLFREIGYQKTTVADIAKVLRMSPANVYRFFDSKKAIHEGVARSLMGEVAMEESWDVCVAHMERITQTIGSVIAEGVATGEFEAADLPLAAMCACTAMMRFFHPQMIAQCALKPGPSIDQMIDFVIAGLSPRAGSAALK